MKNSHLLLSALLLSAAPLCAQTASDQPVKRAELVANTAPAAAAASPAAKDGQTPDTTVPLRHGDVLEIRIANVPPDDQQQWDSLTYTVDESGNLNLPFIGLVKVAGMPASQVQIVIQNKLVADGIYTNPTIALNQPMGLRFVSVGGAVRAPQRIQYTPDLTLMSAINSAGGAGDFAGDAVNLVRGGKIVKFSRKKLTKDPSKDPRIEPGDQITVVDSPW